MVTDNEDASVVIPTEQSLKKRARTLHRRSQSAMKLEDLGDDDWIVAESPSASSCALLEYGFLNGRVIEGVWKVLPSFDTGLEELVNEHVFSLKNPPCRYYFCSLKNS